MVINNSGTSNWLQRFVDVPFLLQKASDSAIINDKNKLHCDGESSCVLRR